MSEDKLSSKIIEIHEKTDNVEIKTLIKFMLTFQLRTLTRVSKLQTITIDMLEKATSQVYELHDVNKQIKELESLRDETQVEIQKLKKIKNQLEIV